MVSVEAYRDAMSRLGAAVNVVTTDGEAGRHGFTASAVCSVTDAPPTLLVCINRANRGYAAFLSNRVLCVNVLAGAHQPLSPVFGGADDLDMETRFSHADWGTLLTGAPVLRGALVSFDCGIVDTAEIGTHTVVFAEVCALSEAGRGEGLIYFGRAYHRVTG